MMKLCPVCVGVFGFYSQGNFGDDLMALMFAKLIEDHGGKPLIFGLDKELAAKHGYESTASIDVFVKSIDVFCLGGGGFLTEPKYTDYELEFIRKLTIIKNEICRRSIPSAVLSIGGSGLGQKLPYDEHIEFLKIIDPRFLRVRLRTDVEFLAEFGINATYAPDVVLSTHEVFPNSKYDHASFHLCLQGMSFNLYMLTPILLLGRLFGLRVLFVNTKSAKSDYPEQIFPKGLSFLCRLFKCYQINDPVEALLLISSCNVIFSNKLHLGIAGMSYGARFYGNSRNKKVKAFFYEIGAERYLIGSRIEYLWRVVYSIIRREKTLGFSGSGLADYRTVFQEVIGAGLKNRNCTN